MITRPLVNSVSAVSSSDGSSASLGRCRRRIDRDHELALGGGKQRPLLATLALEANTVLSVDMLAEGVWGERVPERYIQNIQVYVSTLRKILEPDRLPKMPSRIRAQGIGYEIVLAPNELDLSRFRSRVSDGMRLLEANRPALAQSRTPRRAVGMARTDLRGSDIPAIRRALPPNAR